MKAGDPVPKEHVLDLAARLGHERVLLIQEPAAGLRAVIAIHDTTLGVAVGGTRMRTYPAFDDAVEDALRLSCAMTSKAAFAGMPYGGGKAVIFGDPRRDKTPELLLAFARAVDELGGRFLTGGDMGIGNEDLKVLLRGTRHIGCTPSGANVDASDLTAIGVVSAMRAVAERLGRSLSECRVAIQGVGEVGGRLAEKLAGKGVGLIVTDTVRDRLDAVVRATGARAVLPKEIFDVECDLFSPNAAGGVIDSEVVERLRCAAVVGAANNPLGSPEVGEQLWRRGVLYAPDFVVNAGGLLSVLFETGVLDEAGIVARVERIGADLAELLDRAEREGAAAFPRRRPRRRGTPRGGAGGEGELSSAPWSAILRPPPGAGDDGRWWRFLAPVERRSATTLAEVRDLLASVERATEDGLWAVGFVGYEAAPAFDASLAVRAPATGALAAFSFFPSPELVDAPPGADLAAKVEGLQPLQGETEHAVAIATVHAAIAAGETYQVNLTFPLQGRIAGDPEALFWRLAPASAAPHAAFLDCGDTALVSLSPELFFRRENGRVTMRPMKGTRTRGRYSEEDEVQAAALAASPKERAENLMIVDMVRNDLGRIARTGSVAVESLFALERYPTVWQMTSTVTARSPAGLPELFGALFPCASVTGAPKARTMEWIARLERRPRGVYCGAIGWAAPRRRASFSVAIRTAVVERSSETLEYGVGSGVVWDSEPAAEYRECLAKAGALEDPGTALRAHRDDALAPALRHPAARHAPRAPGGVRGLLRVRSRPCGPREPSSKPSLPSSRGKRRRSSASASSSPQMAASPLPASLSRPRGEPGS